MNDLFNDFVLRWTISPRRLKKGFGGDRSNKPRCEQLEARHLMTVSLPAIADGVINSAEANTDTVTAYYQDYLQRPPDPAGLNGWLNQLDSGMPEQQVQADFLSSPEYIGDHGGGGSAWINSVYQNVLGRPADPSGLQSWSNALSNGVQPYNVAGAITNSAERDQDVVTTDYANYLGRVPSVGEANGWVSQLENGATPQNLVDGFLTSNEYYANRGVDNNTTWLISAYRDALHRNPDPVAYQGWLNQSLDDARQQASAAYTSAWNSYLFGIQQDPSGYPNYANDAITPEGPGSQLNFTTPYGLGYNTIEGFQTPLSLGPFSYTPQNGAFGLDTPFGTFDIGPTSTSFSAGPSFSGFSATTPLVSYPYGYQNASQDLYNIVDSVLGPANDYGTWMNMVDPFGYNLGY